ncbi:M28 family peptidase [Catenulispora pinisilvae]|uniref:M28 family peptidase n=1 Tax=Catenulispora pinisilvae TaxID=2705253 RepID=UPI0018925AB4|nr:M28 family peptidase [Catenulispora pinisilvae]
MRAAADEHPDHRPGASDNASGVAVALDAARLLKNCLPQGIGLSIALLDGQEIGTLGSAHHATRLAAKGRSPLIINVDRAGELNGSVAVAAGGTAMPILTAMARPDHRHSHRIRTSQRAR